MQIKPLRFKHVCKYQNLNHVFGKAIKLSSNKSLPKSKSVALMLLSD
jgi:hypothetical protein